MKSIKLASGFAVSALALAIAGQATAQTANVTFSGDLKVQTIIDLENNQYRNAQPGLISATEDWYNLDARWAFSNGPFSGRLRVGTFGHTGNAKGTDGRAGNALVTVDSLLVTEGPVQFGQVARVTATAGLYESLTKENDLFQAFNNSENAIGDESTRFDVDFGLRYTVSDLGVVLQLESTRRVEGIFGVAGSLYQDLDVAKFWVDGQYRIGNIENTTTTTTTIENITGDDIKIDEVENNTAASGMVSDNAVYNVGVALQVQPVEQVTLTGVYRLVTATNFTPEAPLSGTDTAVTRDLTIPTPDPRSVMAVKLDVEATEEVSMYVLVTDRDLNNQVVTDSTVVRGGLTASVAPFVVEAGYEANFASPSAGLIFTKATWTDGPLSAFVGLDYNLAEFSSATTEAGYKLSAGGDYTTVSGIVYGAEYTYADKKFWGEDDVVNQVELFASYSF